MAKHTHILGVPKKRARGGNIVNPVLFPPFSYEGITGGMGDQGIDHSELEGGHFFVKNFARLVLSPGKALTPHGLTSDITNPGVRINQDHINAILRDKALRLLPESPHLGHAVPHMRGMHRGNSDS
eukprot:9074161-Pyramimonas_sp.AAC.1